MILAILTGALTSVVAAPPAHAETWVEQENQLPGSSGWNVPTEQWALPTQLSAYTTAASVTPGQPVVLRIDNRISESQRVTAYRVGWYAGAGGREIARSDWAPATVQPQPRLTRTNSLGGVVNMVDASEWSDTMSVPTTGWPEGVYLLVVEETGGLKVQVPFVVRSTAHAGRTAIVAAPPTWQAYNRFGGYSAYTGMLDDGSALSSTARSRMISLNRPLDRDYGVAHFMIMERAAVVEAERTGVDLSYTTSVDIARDGSAPHRGARALIGLGHDEYWSNSQWASVRELRDAGTNLVFAGANTLWWRIRYDQDLRSYEIYKLSSEDPVKTPDQTTTNFSTSYSLSLLGSRYSCSSLVAPLVVIDPSFFLFKGTGATKGSTYPALLNIEVDSAQKSTSNPANLSIAARSPFTCRGTTAMNADLTYYTVPSGAGVVNFSTMGFVVALDDLNRDRFPMPQESIDFARQVFRNAVVEASAGPLGRTHIPSGNARSILEPVTVPPPAPEDSPLNMPEVTTIVPTVRGSGVFGDMTGDRRADIIGVTKATGDLQLYVTGNGPTLTSQGKVGSAWQVMTWISPVHDLNGDGRVELAARRSDGTLWLYPGSDRGRWRAPTRIGSGWNSMSLLTVSPDLNGDGRPDLVARSSDGKLKRYGFTGLGKPLTPGVQVGHGWQSMTSLVAVGDLSGDTKPDIVAVRSDGYMFTYVTTRTGGLVLLRQVGHGWRGFTHILSPGDMDGDGRYDLVGVRADGTMWYYRNGGRYWTTARRIGHGWTTMALLA
ncbi:N,N-dimethylformamidase beta subunit family domain-containing protein [Aestuariimicrobium ganziense]|uniref:N,N-dimethylformamidase beta subunit family domain-containing protein n=1 Tax=Aestuariimicrobium ganziense TaxID=2773677 RepID=UPI001941F9E4|nr:N,N-dimethylformamidase beta subunit family domain-containing protein [Aestuariimicrobium ganziense]